MSGYSKLIVVAGFTAMQNALLRHPDAHIVAVSPLERIDLPLFDPYELLPAAIEPSRSRGPKPRRKWPVRR